MTKKPSPSTRTVRHSSFVIRHFPTLAWSAVTLWAGTIFYLSSLSGRELQQIVPFDFWDKFLHFAAFAVGGVLLAAALRVSCAWPWKWLALFAIVALSLYGVSDEIHQLYTPFRSGGDFGDWLADTLGGAAGVASLRRLCGPRPFGPFGPFGPSCPSSPREGLKGPKGQKGH